MFIEDKMREETSEVRRLLGAESNETLLIAAERVVRELAAMTAHHDRLVTEKMDFARHMVRVQLILAREKGKILAERDSAYETIAARESSSK